MSRQAMVQEQQALFKKHKTNPLSSCLPLLVQMPFFFALFRVLTKLRAPVMTAVRSVPSPLNISAASTSLRFSVLHLPRPSWAPSTPVPSTGQ